MKRVKRNSDDESKSPDLTKSNSGRNRYYDTKCGYIPIRLTATLIVWVIVFSLLFSVSIILRDPPSDNVSAFAEARVLHVGSNKEEVNTPSTAPPRDKLLGGLLIPGFDDKSCLSRYQSALYRKDLFHKPSSYLISRLRNYEALHKRCGPNTESYKKSLQRLKDGQYLNSSSDCNYVVWISFSGLGNRILTLASAFLYALLTNRVLLVDPGVDMPDLFCEPFPEVSWLLTPDFPLTGQLSKFDKNSTHRFGNLVKNSSVENPFVYLHLAHDYDDHDKLFFCDDDQSSLKKIPWLIMKTDNYFIPSLFLIPSVEQELHKLFPLKDTVFHFLGRYLFHPTNSVWGLVTRYYDAYLAKSDEKIGVQIRVFETGTGPFQYVLDQVLSCTMKENLLPEINLLEPFSNPPQNQRSKAVLLTSLSSGYFEKIRNMYWEHSTVTGEVIAVYQPSNEQYQQTDNKIHHKKAWAEMYLLSLMDVLVTSSWSTFGYVAQGLGGLKPWILYKPENQTAPDPPCQRAVSMEPCFHAPPFYDCKAKTGIDTGSLVPHIRHCEDMSWGLKLVNHNH